MREIETHKHNIAEKEEELKCLSNQLQMQEAMLQQKLKQQQANTAKCQLELEDQVHSLTNEVTELQSKLVQVEDEKQEAVRQLEADQKEKMFLREFIDELTASESKVRWRALRRALHGL